MTTRAKPPPADAGSTTVRLDGSTLETERLLLRPLTVGDLEDVLVYQSDAETLRYMLWPVRSRDEAAEHLSRRCAMTSLERDGDALVLAVTTKDDPARVIGEMNVRLTSVDSRQSEVGWILNPAFQGRGYAYEAASRMIELCVDELGSHRVHAELDPLNTASSALCLKLGMRQEAHLREDMYYKGRWSDTGVYAILASEWRARRDQRAAAPA